MYIIIELQTNTDGTVGSIVQKATTINQAKSIYHSVLAAAAISSVPIHSCTILDSDALQICSESFHHGEVNIE